MRRSVKDWYREERELIHVFAIIIALVCAMVGSLCWMEHDSKERWSNRLIKFQDGSTDVCDVHAHQGGFTLDCRTRGQILGATNFVNVGKGPK